MPRVPSIQRGLPNEPYNSTEISNQISSVPSNGLRSQQNITPLQPVFCSETSQLVLKSPRVPFTKTLNALPCTPLETLKQNNKELELLTESTLSPRAIYSYCRKKPELFSPRRVKASQGQKSLFLLNNEKQNASLTTMAAQHLRRKLSFKQPPGKYREKSLGGKKGEIADMNSEMLERIKRRIQRQHNRYVSHRRSEGATKTSRVRCSTGLMIRQTSTSRSEMNSTLPLSHSVAFCDEMSMAMKKFPSFMPNQKIRGSPRLWRPTQHNPSNFSHFTSPSQVGLSSQVFLRTQRDVPTFL